MQPFAAVVLLPPIASPPPLPSARAQAVPSDCTTATDRVVISGPAARNRPENFGTCCWVMIASTAPALPALGPLVGGVLTVTLIAAPLLKPFRLATSVAAVIASAPALPDASVIAPADAAASVAFRPCCRAAYQTPPSVAMPAMPRIVAAATAKVMDVMPRRSRPRGRRRPPPRATAPASIEPHSPA